MTATAHRLRDPAVRLVARGVPRHGSAVTTQPDARLADALEEFRGRLLAAATESGPNLLSSPDVYAFRADAPVARVRVQVPGITVAVIADQRKEVHFSDGARFVYRPGSYLCCTRAMQYESAIPAASPQRPYLSLGLRLRPELVAETVVALDDAGEDAGDVDAFVAQLDAPLLDTFLRLLRAVEDPVEARLVAPLVIREAVVRLLRAELARPLRRAAQTDDGRIRRAMGYIRQYAHRRLSVEGVAKEVAMSPSHFAHRFRQVARMTPMQYAKQQRLLRARLLLLDDRRVSEVAREVGYQSAAQFTRDFKASYGSPPAMYVQRFRELAS